MALLGLCLWVYVAACNEEPEVVAQSQYINPLLQQMAKLSFDNAMGLGAHQMEGTLKVSSEGESRTIQSTETYRLAWEGWKNYAYKVTKNERPTMDVVIGGNQAYQLRGNRAVKRDNLHDFHYYLQKTWNLWATAVRPFGEHLELKELRTTAREGRPTTEYQVSLREGAQRQRQSPGNGTSRIRYESVEGNIWVDKATNVPLSITFHGTYVSIRPSRLPGKKDSETVHEINLDVTRSNFGKSQNIELPEVLPERPRPQNTSRNAPRRTP